MNELPLYAVDLIKQLDAKYPHRCPKPTDSDREIWIKVGQRMVVDNLLTLLENEDMER